VFIEIAPGVGAFLALKSDICGVPQCGALNLQRFYLRLNDHRVAYTEVIDDLTELAHEQKSGLNPPKAPRNCLNRLLDFQGSRPLLMILEHINDNNF